MRHLGYLAGGVAFVALATLNAGGYRYGAADQAFYIPAVLKEIDPALYPRDTALVGPQARYFFVDEIVAGLSRVTGGSMETWFALGYLLTLVVLYTGLWRLGHLVFRSPWAVWALIAAETLRHRITRTGVNTLEGYFHPRTFVFAVGVWAIAAYLGGRPWLALGLVAGAGLLHPTTAAFFALLLGVAIWTSEPGLRRVLTGVVIVGGLAAVMLLAGPMRGTVAPMDEAWRGLLASKDYLFPAADWAAGAWIANLGTAALALAVFGYRVRHGIGRPREAGLLAGAAALLAGFLVTLPAVSAGSALFVQLQISRVFWILDLLATVALVSVLVDGSPGAIPRERARWRLAVPAVLLAASIARGVFVGFVEHGDRPPVALTLPDDEWTRVIRWAGAQPIETHFLADPGHAYRYGTPLRYAGRDVFLEEVKDTAMAIYSRESAGRVLDRQQALGDFQSIDAASARALAARFEIDYLVIDRDLALPLAHREGGFRIYALR